MEHFEAELDSDTGVWVVKVTRDGRHTATYHMPIAEVARINALFAAGNLAQILEAIQEAQDGTQDQS